jgi:flagellar FliL protein
MSDDDREDLLEEAADALKDEDSAEKGGGKKKIFLFLLLILLFGGGAGVYYSGLLDEITEETTETAVVVEPTPQPSKYYDLPDMLVNLNSENGKPSYIKLRASLELDEDTDTLLLTVLKPRIIDKFIVYMRELRLTDLRASAGLTRLREELRIEINKAVSPVEVKQVLFRNILVQ